MSDKPGHDRQDDLEDVIQEDTAGENAADENAHSDAEPKSVAQSPAGASVGAVEPAASLLRRQLFGMPAREPEGLAKDLANLTAEVQELRRAQSRLTELVETLMGTVHEAAMAHGRELGQLRDQLLGDRRAMAASSVFHAIVEPLGQFRDLRSSIDSDGNSPLMAQLDGIIEVVSRTLRSLGFVEFRPAKGDAFDPASMEAMGFAEGDPGVVLEVVRSGFRAGAAIVRPAGVSIAAPIGT